MSRGNPAKEAKDEYVYECGELRQEKGKRRRKGTKAEGVSGEAEKRGDGGEESEEQGGERKEEK